MGHRASAGRRRGYPRAAPCDRRELGLRTGPGPGPGQPLGPLLRDLGRGARARCRAGRRQHPRAPGRRVRLAAGGSDGEALRRLLGVDQRPRPSRSAAADPLPAGHLPPGICGWHRCWRCDRHGRFRLDQQRPRDRVPLPVDRRATPEAWLQGRRDQRLRRRAGAPERVSHRVRFPRRDREGGQRRRRRQHDSVRLRPLEQRSDPGRPERARVREADRRLGSPDPDAEVRVGTLRPPIRRSHDCGRSCQGKQGSGAQGRGRVDDAAPKSKRDTSAHDQLQARRHRSERGLGCEPARRLERELARRLRRREPRVLYGGPQPDPAGDNRPRRDPGPGLERDLGADRPGRDGRAASCGRRGDELGRRGRGCGRRASLRRGARRQPDAGAAG